MLETGTTAPDFDLPGSDGEEISRYQLADYLDNGPVVLLFYPFDFSPVCTAELCEFRDSEWLTLSPNVDVFGISTDSAFAHREVIQDNQLPFPLLSDHDGNVSENYDALYSQLEGHPTVSKRAVALIDTEQTIRYAWEADEWLTDPDVPAVHRAIISLPLELGTEMVA